MSELEKLKELWDNNPAVQEACTSPLDASDPCLAAEAEARAAMPAEAAKSETSPLDTPFLARLLDTAKGIFNNMTSENPLEGLQQEHAQNRNNQIERQIQLSTGEQPPAKPNGPF